MSAMHLGYKVKIIDHNLFCRIAVQSLDHLFFCSLASFIYHIQFHSFHVISNESELHGTTLRYVKVTDNSRGAITEAQVHITVAPTVGLTLMRFLVCTFDGSSMAPSIDAACPPSRAPHECLWWLRSR